MQTHSIYRCPVCKAKLDLNKRSFVCENRHNFDMSREGYVNLLLANQKRSQEPGDNKTMVSTRRQFFLKGFYKPVSDKVNELVCACFDRRGRTTAVNVLDCGCGEGYFLRNLHPALAETGMAYGAWGIDISKFAVKAAAKLDKETNWAVASIYDLPILPQSVDCVLNIMAPQSVPEINRVLRPQGNLIVVTPGPTHLSQLRKRVYERPQDHKEPVSSLPGFKFIDRHRVSYTCDMDNRDISNVFVMTPYSWNASPDTRAKIMSLPHLMMEIDFMLTVFEKT